MFRRTFIVALLPLSFGCSNPETIRPTTARLASPCAVALRPNETLHSCLPVVFPNTNVQVFRAVAIDLSSSASRKIAVAPDGTEADYQSLHEAEVASARSKRGAIDEQLAAALQPLAPADDLAVDLQYAPDPLPARPLIWSPQVEQKHAADVASALKKNGDVVESEIVASGGKVQWRSPNGPFINAVIPKATLLTAVAKHPLVVRLALPGHPEGISAMQGSKDLKADTVFHPGGYYGLGTKVGIYERGCAMRRIHPYDAFSSYITKNSAVYSCGTDADCRTTSKCQHDMAVCILGWCYDYHALAVAGNIGHWDLNGQWPPPPLGGHAGPRIAPRVGLYHSTGPTPEGLSWLASNSVWIQNASLYHYHAPIDWYSAVQGVTLTYAAGNTPTATVNGSQAAAIWVGGYSASPAYPFYADRWEIYGDTSYLNPSNCNNHVFCDREYPHLVAHGQGVGFLESNWTITPIQVGLGTSFAAPQIAGLAALMSQRWPSLFYRWTETIKAALMTSSAGWDLHTPAPPKTYSDYLAPDEKDGAGVPSATNIQTMATASPPRVLKQTFLGPSSHNANKEFTWTSVYLSQGTKVRAVLVFSLCSTYSWWNDAPTADLDLKVYGPSGTSVTPGMGMSWDGEYEIVEFTAATSGYYTIRDAYYTWGNCSDGTGQRVSAGLAWNIVN